MSSRPGAGKILLLALCLGIGLPLAAYPRGRMEKEDRQRLAQAAQLIDERKYNQAILALRDLLQRNPELFDEAEKQMERIRSARSDYNAKFEELIKALFEENDVPKGLALIAELEALDPFPNDAVARALEQAKVGRELVVNLNRFNRIMDEAAALLAQGSYAEANARYLEGFALGRESFDAADYGNILKNSVLASLESLESAVAAFPPALEGLRSAEGVLRSSLAPLNLSGLNTGIGQLSGAARGLSALEGAAREAGHNFQTQGRLIGERPGGRGYDSFLYFGAQLILGRSGKPREGIAAVLAIARENGVSGQKQVLLEAADGLWQQGLQDYERGAYPLERLATAASLYTTCLRLLSLWALGLEAPLSQVAPAAFGLEGAEYLRLRERIRSARGYEELAQVGQAYTPLAQGGVPAPERIAPARQALAELRRRAAGVEQGGGAAAAELRAQGQATGLAVQAAVEEDLALQRAAGSLRGRLEELDLRLLAALADGSLQRMAGLQDSYRTRYQEGVGLQQGVQTPARLEKYPERALAIYNRLGAELGAVGEEAGRLAEEIAREPGYLEASAPLRESAQGLAAEREKLAELQAQIAGSTASAQAAALQAGRYRQEGLLRVQDTRRHLAVDPLREAAARESLQNAQEAFDRSLEYQEDAEVRRLRDDTLPQLAEEINAAVNRRVIREVRERINGGKRLYSLGDYNGAEQEFVRADSRWKDTILEPNREIEEWLTLTRNAIQNIAGREIALSNPLYPQMMQLYNLAYREYLEGRRLVEQGRVPEALPLLNKAVERLTQIKTLFPYNSEAQILTLRIEQLRDRDRFREVLDTNFRDALGKREVNPAEALNTLEVIRVLSPAYPGLARAIGDLRIQLGMDRPPPDPAKQTEARRLYAEALRTWNSNQRVLFPRAMELLNTAIALYPEFREAVDLKDRMQGALGASRQLLLSSDDQRRFREAEGLFLNGQYPDAYQIVNELLRKPGNQGYRPLLELRANIAARLGI